MAKKTTIASRWNSEIEKSEKYMKTAHTHGEAVYKRYEDDRDGAQIGIKKANIFFANVNTLKESLFNSLPKSDVRKIHQQAYNDELSRVTAMVAQRCLDYEIQCACDFREAVTLAILDRLVPGLGQLWCSFDMDKEESEPDADGNTTENTVPGTESLKIEHVEWTDFLFEPCKRWSRCTWVGRKHHMTKNDFISQFGEDNYSKTGGTKTTSADNSYDMQDVNKNKLCVYEIWDKRTKKVYFIYKGMDDPLSEQDDPYHLASFFPCPAPLIANQNTRKFYPHTDYHFSQDQYNQLDTLYARMGMITDAIKVAGIYDSSAGELTRMLTEGENKLIPCDNWAMMAENGGVSGKIEWYPVEQVVKVLSELTTQFASIKGLLSEISGMSDIVRGDSNQYETAKAQQIKAQFASVRMNGYQRDVSYFVQDTLRIMADLVFGLYSDQKILEIVGDIDEPDQQYLPQVAQILRSDERRKYRINIQADSLTQADWDLEKGQRQEIVQVLGQMIGQTMQLVQQAPQMASLAAQMIKFAISGYKGSSELQGWIDQQLDQMQKAAQNPQPKPPSPEEQKAQAEMQQMQAQAQMDQQTQQAQMQAEQQKNEMDMQMKQMELVHKQKIYELELQMKQAEMALKQQEAQMKMQNTAQSAELDAQVSQANAAIDLKNKQDTNDQSLQANQQKFDQQAKNKPTKGAE